MEEGVLIITGAAGFLGSAISVDLAPDYRITAIDRREPGRALREAAPGVAWERLDIADAGAVAAAFQRTRSAQGRLDCVLHLAAFYHFGADWRPEYERTNLRGTSHVLEAAVKAGARRFIFASSVAAMAPPPPGQALTEKSPAGDFIPYAKSKMMGEAMLAQRAHELPVVVLRIAGAFSDWCELPPLHSLISRWSGRGPLARMIPGRGESGIPYIHRSDVVRIARRCIQNQAGLDAFEVFLASQEGAVSLRTLFPLIHPAARPLYIAPGLARLGLRLGLALASITGRVLYERAWMLDFVDRPWLMDTRYTRQKLGWQPSPGMGILERLPVILERRAADRRAWEARNRRRDQRDYLYSAPA